MNRKQIEKAMCEIGGDMHIAAENLRIGAELIHRWPRDLRMAATQLQCASGCITTDRRSLNRAIVHTNPDDVDLTALHLLANELDQAVHDVANLSAFTVQALNGVGKIDTTQLGLVARETAGRVAALQKRIAAFRFATSNHGTEHTEKELKICHV